MSGPALYDVCADSSAFAGDVRAGVVGVVLGLLLLAVVWQRRDRAPRVLAFGFLAVWVGVSAANAVSDRRAQREACRTLTAGRVLVAEGEVRDLSPLAANGQGYETFKIGEALFRIAPGHGPGLSRIVEKGGPIREGRRLRVTYSGDAILKVEEITPQAAR